jgi:acid phosphatase (class A)
MFQLKFARRWISRLVYLPALLMVSATLFTVGAAPPAAYLTAGAVDVTDLLPPPPVAGSPEAQEEVAVVLQLQEARTAEQIARAQSEKTLTVAAFARTIGPWFELAKLPRTAALFNEIETESKPYVTKAKDAFARPRPPATDPRVKPIFPDTDASYPSGHSTRAMMESLILAEVLPDLKPKLITRAQEIGWDRVIAGVHFPSDVDAGRVVGQRLARLFLANPAFRADLEQVRAELAAARQAVPASVP